MDLKALAISAPYAATSSMPAQHLLVNGCWYFEDIVAKDDWKIN